MFFFPDDKAIPWIAASRSSDQKYKHSLKNCFTMHIGIGEEENLPLAIVGGNCSIQGFDYEGNDPFWTVTGK